MRCKLSNYARQLRVHGQFYIVAAYIHQAKPSPLSGSKGGGKLIVAFPPQIFSFTNRHICLTKAPAKFYSQKLSHGKDILNDILIIQ